MLIRQVWMAFGIALLSAAGNGARFEASLIRNAGEQIRDFVQFESQILFTEGNGLWISDGTSAHTRMLHTFKLDEPIILAPGQFGQFFYFSADDGEHGHELWRTDGTAAGTRMVVDLNQGVADGFLGRGEVAGHRLFLWASTPATGFELFVSDGTPEGTDLCKQFTHAAADTTLNGMRAWGSKLLISVNSPVSQNRIWISDGTQSGTAALLTESDVTAVDNFVSPLGANYIFSTFTLGGSGTTAKVWATDGTKAGTRLLTELARPLEPQRNEFSNEVIGSAVLNDRLFFIHMNTQTRSGTHSTSFFRIWQTDGTAAETQPFTGESGYGYSHLLSINGFLVFSQRQEFESFLRYYDGATLVESGFGVSAPPVLLNGQIYFFGRNPQIEGAPFLINRISSFNEGPQPVYFPQGELKRNLFGASGTFLYWFDHSPNSDPNYRLWISDGTAAGTEKVETQPGMLWTFARSYPLRDYLVIIDQSSKVYAIRRKSNSVTAWEAYR